MALLFLDSFDAGDIATKWIPGSFTSVSSSTTRFGTGMVAVVGTSDAAARSITPSAQVTIGVAFYSSAGECGVAFRGDAGTTTHLSIMRTAGGVIDARRGLAGAGTSLARGTTIIPPLTWNYLEVQATVADSGGTVKVRLNGATTNEIDFTGDTKNGGTSTNIDQVALITSTSGSSARFDDVYVLNSTGSSNTTFLGDIRIHALSPSNNGTYSQLTGSDGNQVDNFQLVDEKPFSTTDYVGSPTVGQRDTYVLADLPSVTQIFGVQNNFIGAKSDASTGNAKSALLINSTLYYGTTRALGTSYVPYSDVYDTNPNTSTAWTDTVVNGMEAGMEVA
ncbi:MAG TPA: hypothetical protein VFO38_03280 [Candidatus Saccharimonadales bacterium]|nr:hypothetical protein [Candidatus Saccharimonadales bacterium]